MRSSTETLVKALRILARDIQSGDGVANAAIAEAADRLAELKRENADYGLTIVTIEDIVTDDKRSNKAKVLAIQYVLRKKAQPIRADHSGDINEMMQARKEAQP